MKKKIRPRCHNCKFAGPAFKLGKVTHMHCENEEYYKELLQTEEHPSPYDTLFEFYHTCERHQFKEAVHGS
jgi:hypothetical protein